MRGMKSVIVAGCISGWGAGALAQPADVELWRLDCGKIEVSDKSLFSDAFHFRGEALSLTDSCYLIRHGADYVLWDTGLSTDFLGAPESSDQPFTLSLAVSLADQLAEIGLAPEDISRLGISHYHFDHLGQAGSFPGAGMMIGAADLAALQQDPLPFGADPSLAAPWLSGEAEVQAVEGDLDVFGDGSVVMLAAPGHTPGSSALLVTLAETGPVLLSGDVVHFHDQIPVDGVPPFNTDRADSLASMARIEGIAEALGAVLVIQHDPADIAKLPAFPASAQ